MITVLVLLAAVSLLTFSGVERSTMSILMGHASARSQLQRDALMDAIALRVSSGLVPGPVGDCVLGSCGRSESGAQRVWTVATVALHGVPTAETSMCSPIVVAEFLGAADEREFWKLAATCRDGAAGRGLVAAQAQLVGGVVSRMEWVAE